jgi:hypothetical protein
MTHSIPASRMVELCTLPLALQCIARVPVDAESGSATNDVPCSYLCFLCIDELSDQNAQGFYCANERCARAWSVA